MRAKIFATIAALIAIATFLTLPIVALAAPNPFIGAWEATDIDGSHERLQIGGSSMFHIIIYDDGASACGLDSNGNPLYAARVTGTGTASGNILTVDYTVLCLAKPAFVLAPGSISFTYDSSTDTLTDSVGAVYYRVG